MLVFLEERGVYRVWKGLRVECRFFVGLFFFFVES